MRRILKKLLDFAFPVQCVSCELEGANCCPQCASKIERNPKTEKIPENFSLFSATAYREHETIGKLIRRFKYDGAGEAGEILAGLFPKNKPACLAQETILVPVPLHRSRFNFRGFNQSLIIANALAKRWDLSVADIIKRNRKTKPQVELSGRERIANVKGAFSALNSASKQTQLDASLRYCLVDDVFTTGATMEECRLALENAGARNIFGIVIAKTRFER